MSDNKKPKEIKWATPEWPHGLWANCIICGKDIKHLRTRKNVCSEECRVIKQRNIENASYAAKMARDPDYAKKQSAKQYARIKEDPEKWQAHQAAQHERRQLENYKASTAKSIAKYRANNAEKVAASHRRYAETDHGKAILAAAEARRTEKLRQLKIDDPASYQAHLDENAVSVRRYAESAVGQARRRETAAARWERIKAAEAADPALKEARLQKNRQQEQARKADKALAELQKQLEQLQDLNDGKN